MRRGYFGIGICRPKTQENYGTLLRSAHSFGAAYAFVIGPRFRRQASDTTKAWRHMPLFEFKTFDEMRRMLPYDTRLIGVELDERAMLLQQYTHPERACYVLGSEDAGLSEAERKACHALVEIGDAARCLNVATAGSIVLYDRVSKA